MSFFLVFILVFFFFFPRAPSLCLPSPGFQADVHHRTAPKYGDKRGRGDDNEREGSPRPLRASSSGSDGRGETDTARARLLEAVPVAFRRVCACRPTDTGHARRCLGLSGRVSRRPFRPLLGLFSRDGVPLLLPSAFEITSMRISPHLVGPHVVVFKAESWRGVSKLSA